MRVNPGVLCLRKLQGPEGRIGSPSLGQPHVAFGEAWVRTASDHAKVRKVGPMHSRLSPGRKPQARGSAFEQFEWSPNGLLPLLYQKTNHWEKRGEEKLKIWNL